MVWTAYDEDDANPPPNPKDLLITLGVLLSVGLLAVPVLAYIVARK